MLKKELVNLGLFLTIMLRIINLFIFFITDFLKIGIYQIVTKIVQCTNKRIAEDTKDVTETEIGIG